MNLLKRTGRARAKIKYDAHIGYAILGKTALALEDLASAEKHLYTMAQFGDPNWKHDLCLARLLLERNRKTAVCDYLALCRRNFVRRLKQLERFDADEYKLPALVSMQRDWINPQMTLTDFQRTKIGSQIEDIDQWITSISKGRRCLLPDSIA